MSPQMKSVRITIIATVALALLTSTTARANDDDFGSVVKIVEQFYHVKHQGIPFLAKVGVKALTAAARIKGGTAKQIAEAGSIKLAVFEDQKFDSGSEFTRFRTLLIASLNKSWTPFIQTLSARDGEQTYIFLRSAGDKFNVLLITIEPREATVVQVTVSAKNLALLMKDPDGMGKAITNEATIIDQD